MRPLQHHLRSRSQHDTAHQDQPGDVEAAPASVKKERRASSCTRKLVTRVCHVLRFGRSKGKQNSVQDPDTSDCVVDKQYRSRSPALKLPEHPPQREQRLSSALRHFSTKRKRHTMSEEPASQESANVPMHEKSPNNPLSAHIAHTAKQAVDEDAIREAQEMTLGTRHATTNSIGMRETCGDLVAPKACRRRNSTYGGLSTTRSLRESLSMPRRLSNRPELLLLMADASSMTQMRALFSRTMKATAIHRASRIHVRPKHRRR